MSKKLIIGLSIAFVVIATGVFGVILLRSKVLSDTENISPLTSGNGLVVPQDSGGGRNPTSLLVPEENLVIQEGICGDNVCEEGEQWCKVDCGSKQERFQGSVKTSQITSTSFALHWETDTPSTGTIRYGASEQYELGTKESSFLSTKHEVLLTGLSPGGGYYILLTVTEKDGTVSEFGPLFYETPGQ